MIRPASFLRDRRGVSAIEFALIAPLLILLFVGSFEITRAVNMNRQVGLLSRTVSDFISQQPSSVTPARIEEIFRASTAVMYPYPVDPNNLQIHVESIVTAEGSSKIQWSYSPADRTVRASDYAGQDGTSVIKASVRYKPTFIFTFMVDRFNLSDFWMQETTFMAPRHGAPITLN